MATKKTQLLTEPLVKVKLTTETPKVRPPRKKPLATIEAPPPPEPTLSERLQTLLARPVLGPALTASVVATFLTILITSL